ncbi:MAG: PilC/PilY family type IV pilus protein [Sedimenticola sp.]
MDIGNGLFSHRYSWSICCAASIIFFSSQALAISSSSLTQSPLFLVQSAEPLVMLNMSNDHQLYFKAYDDYSNLDSSPEAETTYKHTIDYYGYFDSYKCYSYSSGSFNPEAVTTDKYCDSVTGDWSGNFLNWVSMSRMDAVRKMLYGGMRSTDTSSATVLERAYLPTDAHSFVKYYSDTSDIGKLTPYSSDISVCNTTYASSGNSKDITAPPLMRIAIGNYTLWTAHEVNQCHWSGESNNSNNNDPAVTDIPASTTPPSSSATGSAEYDVRVKVCVAGLLEDNCKTYPSGNAKPIGLLHEYGEDDQIKFGLMTGSYQKNKSGGVLRKNISGFADEVNETTDGVFSAAPTGGGIVDTLNKLRISRFDTGSNKYNDLDSCSFAKFGFSDGECSNWGNPQSELFYESLRYLAGKSATADFSATDTSYINNLGTALWSDPLTSNNYCAPANIIQFNASTSSFDGDQLSGFSDFGASETLNAFTDKVGVGEMITDAGTYFVGSITGDMNKACTAKDLDTLSDATGTCPEAPWLEGTYHISGLAHFAKTESIRSNLTAYDGVTSADVRVKTFGVALSPAQPVIKVPVPNDAEGREVVILPACMEYRGSRHNGNCAIVDFKIVNPHTVTGGTATGKFLVLWESAQYGGDYDQDMGGIIEYEIGSDVDASTAGTEIRVTTDVYGASTGGIHGFGYVISGTTADGLHIHSGHNNFDAYDDTATGIPDCTSGSEGPCSYGDPATSATYYLGTTSATQLETPLFYAAKWGGFEEESNPAKRPAGTIAPNGKPDQSYEWDANNDNLPDTYFYSTNPSELETSLSSVFMSISAEVASASSTAANSQKLDTGTNIFQALFDSSDWSGGLLKFAVTPSTGGLTLDTSSWGATGDAGTLLTSAGRQIITYDPAATDLSNDGMAFIWADMSDAQKAILNTDPDSGSTDENGGDRVAYLRGDQSKEIRFTGGIFRNRSKILGDIISSAPVFVGAPNFGYSDILEASDVEMYSTFKARVAARTKMLYVGANDGMLHGFNAADGSEKLAYVPLSVFPSMTALTSPNYIHKYYVDGSPSAGDVVFSSDKEWHTVVLGGLNAGGQGIYALDVTDPSSFTESNASNIILWEVIPAITDFSELGYTFSRPSIVKNHNGTWVAVFGNGYAGSSGHAVLYVVNIETGALISTVTVDTTGNNGLSTASPVDTNGDGIIDVIYAGDLKGNMWKFIPSDSVTGTWISAFSSSPLFTAPADATGYAQAITSRPEVGLHPNGLPGLMVYFGTGKYIETTDNAAGTDVQRFYGIWDVWNSGSTSSYTDADGVSPGATPSITVSGDNLLQQCVTTGTYAETCASNAASTTGELLQNFDVRFVSTHTISSWNWDSTKLSGKMGWYIDLPERGERQVTSSLLRGGRIIFITTIPSDHACSYGGASWLMELDAADGSALGIPVFDLDGDGDFDADDSKSVDSDGDGVMDAQLDPSSKRSPAILQTPSILPSPDGKKEFKYSSSSKATIDITTENPVPYTQGRKSWIQLK